MRLDGCFACWFVSVAVLGCLAMNGLRILSVCLLLLCGWRSDVDTGVLGARALRVIINTVAVICVARFVEVEEERVTH
jgi:hypothetical protein